MDTIWTPDGHQLLNEAVTAAWLRFACVTLVNAML
jgi:hypothetical protein